ncbi:MAG: hypothetical protein KDK04_10750 [Candidatus Competibacteraceae bacterium]|nr:hypothetical protein [Candidatus Competibacteraceae bacterium]MCB1812183.1 hypothetical protein [Candidatus Competibacteraceae bacterium]
MSFLPASYIWGNRVVIVNADRSIDVQPGDSLSAYSAAIYGNFDHIGKFTRRHREPIINKNMIQVNEKIYHPDPLPEEPGQSANLILPPAGNLPRQPVNHPTQAANPHHLNQFINWLLRTMNPIPNWRFVGSGGGDFGIACFTGQYFHLGLQEKSNPTQTEWFYALAGGLSIGPDTGFPVDGTMAPVSMPSLGTIFKVPTAGSHLSREDICGTFVLLDIGAAFIGGGSATIFMFGFKMPLELVYREFMRLLDGSIMPSQFPFAPSGFVTMAGLNMGLNAGVALRLGTMQQPPF